MNIKRILDLMPHLEEKSVLLLGPRRSGKTFLIEHQVKPDLSFNLLRSEDFNKLSFDPSIIEKSIQKNTKIISIDEIQKLPRLMDEVHSIIEKKKDIRFILTGSSAKNIKKSHTSLMAGRVRVMHLCPFVYPEIKKHNFNLEHFLLSGGLPPVYLSTNSWEELKDYSGSYLREEIQASAFVRKIENYSRFLDAAATTSGQLLNFEQVASDTMIPSRTIKDYYSLLEETLIGHTLNPMRKPGSRKEIATSKFYFFDLGVLNSYLRRKKVASGTVIFGDLFEHFIFLELKAYQLYNRADWDLEFWRTKYKDEVDFVIDKGNVIIEVKSTSKVQSKHLEGLKKFRSISPNKRAILVSQENEKRISDGIEIYPWSIFLNELWGHNIINKQM